MKSLLNCRGICYAARESDLSVERSVMKPGETTLDGLFRVVLEWQRFMPAPSEKVC
ncbi:MAG: hypothetical protein ACK50J_27310 [Planctomyces sp.]